MTPPAPALSPGMVRLQAILTSRNCGILDVTEALALDERLSDYVLHVAHAQRVRGDPPVRTISQAVCVLGLSSLGMIAMRGAAMLAFEKAKSCAGFSVEDFWRHSILSAQVAHEMAGRMSARVCALAADQVYACVLLHDIGQLALLIEIGAPYADLRCRLEPGHDDTRLEDERLGRNHATSGAHVAAAWGLPEPVPAEIRLHHVPHRTDGTAELARLIQCSDLIAHAIAAPMGRSAAEIMREIAEPPQTLSSAALVEVVTAATKWYAKVDDLLIAPRAA